MAQTILVDQDNTLSNFDEATLRFAQNNYNYTGGLNRDTYKGYDILKGMYPKLSNNVISRMFEEMFSATGFWSGMDEMPGASKVMRALYEKYDVFIVTKPWPTSRNCIPEKIEWIKSRLPFFDVSRIIFCGHKHLLHADYLIDDSPEYLATSNCKTTIAFKYPYNEDVKVDYVVESWNDIKKLLL